MNKAQFMKIREGIIKLRADLGQRQIKFIFYGLGALLFVFVFIFVYRPLRVKLRNVQRELNSLQVQLVKQRNNISALKKLNLAGRLMQQKEVSLAIDELTEKGRALGLKFISITPGELQKQIRGNFKVLPIAFRLECSYKSLGQFLAELEEFPRTIAGVENLSIRPREKILPKLDVEVLVNLYIEGKDAQ